jgi:DNA repair exonuclease SbcCD nuclease subunit
VFLADTHLGLDFPIRPRVKRRRRGPDFFRNYRSVLRHAIRTKADLVVHGGDLFFRSRVPGKIVDLAFEPLAECVRRRVPIVIVPGNHERSHLPTSLYLNHPDIHVFDRPRTFRFDIAGVTLALSGFPFERRDIRTRFPRVLQQTGWKGIPAEIRLLCIHQAVEGARVGPSDFTFRGGRDVIRMRDVPARFHAVLAGHIHRRQVLTKTLDGKEVETPVIYAGATERTSFAERFEPKGYFEVTIRRSTPGWELGHLAFHPLPSRPMVELYIDPVTAGRQLGRHLRAAMDGLEADSIVRLRSREPLPLEVRAKLTPEFLRAVFPESMNVECARELFAARG